MCECVRLRHSFRVHKDYPGKGQTDTCARCGAVVPINDMMACTDCFWSICGLCWNEGAAIDHECESTEGEQV